MYRSQENNSARQKGNTERERNRRMIAWACVAAATVIVAVTSFTIVPTGYTGVRTAFGQIDSTPVPAGLNAR